MNYTLRIRTSVRKQNTGDNVVIKDVEQLVLRRYGRAVKGATLRPLSSGGGSNPPGVISFIDRAPKYCGCSLFESVVNYASRIGTRIRTQNTDHNQVIKEL